MRHVAAHGVAAPRRDQRHAATVDGRRDTGMAYFCSSDWHFGSTLSLLVMVVVLAFMGGLQRIDKEEEPRKEVRIL